MKGKRVIWPILLLVLCDVPCAPVKRLWAQMTPAAPLESNSVEAFVDVTQRLGINFNGGDGAVAFGNHLDCPTTAAGLDRAVGKVVLDLFHLLLHARSLFH